MVPHGTVFHPLLVLPPQLILWFGSILALTSKIQHHNSPACMIILPLEAFDDPIEWPTSSIMSIADANHNSTALLPLVLYEQFFSSSCYSLQNGHASMQQCWQRHSTYPIPPSCTNILAPQWHHQPNKLTWSPFGSGKYGHHHYSVGHGTLQDLTPSHCTTSQTPNPTYYHKKSRKIHFNTACTQSLTTTVISLTAHETPTPINWQQPFVHHSQNHHCIHKAPPPPQQQVNLASLIQLFTSTISTTLWETWMHQ